ncbi:integrase domain-containing protein [Vreelandella populi]|uniref:Core-binding (CB) domain-containing protein n=1 Tax=Vreelandella populi TaxID=2498858 RepID=A0A433L8T5_9GAMM|nr:integrase domain-containing protein [Halomonas populi]RUR43618.1 hypothetical protein ELY37_18250 [Halomonas populi]
MASAGRILLNGEVVRKNLSYLSVDSVDKAWVKFADYARSSGVRRLEHVTFDLLVSYGKDLAKQVEEKKYTAAYAQRLISGVNTVMRLAKPDWRRVKAVSDCGVARRVAVRKHAPPGIDANEVQLVVQDLTTTNQNAAAAVVGLCWSLGLRLKEASLLDANKALNQAEQSGYVKISLGTKGGRTRIIKLFHSHQFAALEAAATIQGKGSSVIPSELDWQAFRKSVLYRARKTLKSGGINKFHDLRAVYACQRYQELTGYPAPIIYGKIVDKEKDRFARAVIAKELGHNRISVVSAYVGGLR